MKLPNVIHPKIKLKVPSTGNSYDFRPFLVKEEKVLLMAKESEDASDILVSIKQVVEACSLSDKLDVNNLAIFDLEYLFLKLRMISVEDICKILYIDKEDSKKYTVEVDLKQVEVEFPKDINNIIKVNESMGIKMKYPSASLYDDEIFLSKKDDHLYELIIRCIELIYDGDTVYDMKDYKIEEIDNFVSNLDNKTFFKIKEFLTNIPSIRYETSYTNSNGQERKIVLASLSDFFTLR